MFLLARYIINGNDVYLHVSFSDILDNEEFGQVYSFDESMSNPAMGLGLIMVSIQNIYISYDTWSFRLHNICKCVLYRRKIQSLK